MIGIAANACTIFVGGLLGSCFRSRIKKIKCLMQMLGISIMFMCAVWVLQKALVLSENGIEAHNVFLIMACTMLGAVIGEKIKISERIQKNQKERHASAIPAVFTGLLFFGVGGLQIIGSISAAVNNDGSILITKCFIDLPIALSLGALLGAGVALSSLPVALLQLAIGGIALCAKGFFSVEVIDQLCLMGYVILFFVGFNMVFEGIVKVDTDNMLPSIFLVIIYNLLKNVCLGG